MERNLAEAYLRGRGYTNELLREDLCHWNEGGRCTSALFQDDTSSIRVEDDRPIIYWPAYSGSGKLIGVQTRLVEEKDYRWYQAPDAGHLPIMFGSTRDYQLLWEQRKVILTEGIFDRVALKRALPEFPVIARLSKGVSKQLVIFLKRHAKQVYPVFDNDEAGQKATEKTVRLLGEELEVNPLRLPIKDASEYRARWGVKALRQHLENQLEAYAL